MRKDLSGVNEWAKHTRNTAYGRRGINKRVRGHVKEALRPQSEGRRQKVACGMD